MPSPLLLFRIFNIWGIFTVMEPRIIPIPSNLLKVAAKHEPKNKILSRRYMVAKFI